MVEVSRDGKRVYFTNSLYASWDAQFYPEGINGWMVKLDAEPGGALALDPDVLPRVRRTSGRTRSACRAATPRPTRTASRDHRPTPALGGAGRARRLPRPQPGHGLAVRGRARDAGAQPQGRAALAGPDRDRPRAVDRADRGARARRERRGLGRPRCTSPPRRS